MGYLYQVVKVMFESKSKSATLNLNPNSRDGLIPVSESEISAYRDICQYRQYRYRQSAVSTYRQRSILAYQQKYGIDPSLPDSILFWIWIQFKKPSIQFGLCHRSQVRPVPIFFTNILARHFPCQYSKNNPIIPLIHPSSVRPVGTR